mmetsp:Transcript_40293/g.101433  ORF Transcript_40293/g.101433 Transcript_40293/m.101433 type:complete len:247 (+) Transcript_40293:130-870(+)
MTEQSSSDESAGRVELSEIGRSRESEHDEASSAHPSVILDVSNSEGEHYNELVLSCDTNAPKKKSHFWPPSCTFIVVLVECAISLALFGGRLALDHDKISYIIHSCVILSDSVLIHFILPHSLFMNVGTYCLVIAGILLFHFTQQKLWELLETTLMAVIASAYMILHRHKAALRFNHHLGHLLHAAQDADHPAAKQRQVAHLKRYFELRMAELGRFHTMGLKALFFGVFRRADRHSVHIIFRFDCG